MKQNSNLSFNLSLHIDSQNFTLNNVFATQKDFSSEKIPKKATIKGGDLNENTIESSKKQSTVTHTSRRSKIKQNKDGKSKYVAYKSLIGTNVLEDATNKAKN